MAMIKCPNGHDVPEGQGFCGTCGAKMAKAEYPAEIEKLLKDQASVEAMDSAAFQKLAIIVLVWCVTEILKIGKAMSTKTEKDNQQVGMSLSAIWHKIWDPVPTKK